MGGAYIDELLNQAIAVVNMRSRFHCLIFARHPESRWWFDHKKWEQVVGVTQFQHMGNGRARKVFWDENISNFP